jgi:hypothetical protein
MAPYAIGAATKSAIQATACQRPKSNTSWWRTVNTTVGTVSAITPTQRPRAAGQSSRNAAFVKTTADAT